MRTKLIPFAGGKRLNYCRFRMPKTPGFFGKQGVYVNGKYEELDVEWKENFKFTDSLILRNIDCRGNAVVCSLKDNNVYEIFKTDFVHILKTYDENILKTGKQLEWSFIKRGAKIGIYLCAD